MQFCRIAIALGALLSASAARGQVGTAFTYQGVLENPPGQVMTDTCAFSFTLCDDPAAACSPGTLSSHPAVEVSFGVFTVPDVDFGPGAFIGQARWMEVEVMCTGDSGFTTLSPRVEVRPAPYALRALNGVGPDAGIHVAGDGNVGVGTATPTTKLHVAVAGYNGVLVEGDDNGDARYSMENGGGPHFIFDDDSDDHAFKIESAFGRALAFNTSGPNERLRIDPDGNVGIGTNSPQAQLDVNGAARATTMEITGGSVPEPFAIGWGENVFGEADPPFDTAVIGAGVNYSVAIRSDGTLTGWGWTGNGVIDVPSGTYSSLAAGHYHCLAISTNGSLVGWGWNVHGQTNVPLGTFQKVAAGNTHSLAIRTDGTLVAWGENAHGQTDVPPGTFTAVAAGTSHSVAIRTDGTLVAWGYNGQGQTDVPDGTFTSISTFNDHTLAIRTDGTIAGWGKNDSGQLDLPVGTFLAVAAGNSHSLAIRSDGTLVGWGHNAQGQVSVPPGTFSAITAGQSHSLAIRDNASTPNPGLRMFVDSAFKPGSNTWTIFSDRRLKSNITPLSGALENLLALRGVNFHWRDPATQGGIRGVQMGLIADEVQRVFPQWVGRDARGYQTLSVGGFEALTAEAMRELREEKDCEIERLESQVESLESEISHFKSEISQLKETVKSLGASRNEGSRP